MKKGAIIGKRQMVLAVLVFALGVAVWLNMKYASADGGFDITGALNSSKHLGDAQYVNNPSVESSSSDAAATGTTPDYFTTARADREKARKDAVALLEETISDVKTDSAAKEKAIADVAAVASRIEKEASIETLIKAKGFSDAVVVISDTDVNVVVKGDQLIASQTMQIQDIVQSQTDVKLDNIKIVTVK